MIKFAFTVLRFSLSLLHVHVMPTQAAGSKLLRSIAMSSCHCYPVVKTVRFTDVLACFRALSVVVRIHLMTVQCRLFTLHTSAIRTLCVEVSCVDLYVRLSSVHISLRRLFCLPRDFVCVAVQ